MRHFAKMAVAACVWISTGVYAENNRHADAHVHGVGHLNFAIESGQVHLELEAPGFDILGFESVTSESQRKQLEDALNNLEQEDLWSFTPDAACTLKTASASVVGEDRHQHDHHDHDHHDHHHESHPEEHGHDHHAAAHMDIAATYIYECASIVSLNRISTRLFQRFNNSEQLKVQGLADSGQIAGQMSRQRPEVRF